MEDTCVLCHRQHWAIRCDLYARWITEQSAVKLFRDEAFICRCPRCFSVIPGSYSRALLCAACNYSFCSVCKEEWALYKDHTICNQNMAYESDADKEWKQLIKIFLKIYAQCDERMCMCDKFAEEILVDINRLQDLPLPLQCLYENQLHIIKTALTVAGNASTSLKYSYVHTYYSPQNESLNATQELLATYIVEIIRLVQGVRKIDLTADNFAETLVTLEARSRLIEAEWNKLLLMVKPDVVIHYPAITNEAC